MQSAYRLTRKYWAELLLILSSSVAYLYKLGSYRFFDGDEMIYHQVAHNINKTGDWITQYWRFNLDGSLVEWFEKPPLIIWLKALLIRLPGQIEFWSRLPSALSGIGTVYLTYLIGKRLYDKTTGIIAALVVLSAPGLLQMFRVGRLDGPLVFFFWLAIYFALRFKDHPRYYYLFGGAVGLAAMTKGVTVILLPVILVIVWLWNRELKIQALNPGIWKAAAVALAITLPWHAAELIKYGGTFWKEYFGFHVWQRIKESLVNTGGANTGISLTLNKQNSYYLKRLYDLFYPWIFILPFAWTRTLINSLAGIKPARLLMVTTTVIFVFFSFLATKAIYYTAPAYPAFAIMVALTLLDAWRNKRLVSVLGVIFAAIMALLTLPYTTNSKPALAAISLLAIVAMSWFWFQSKASKLHIVLGLCIMILTVAATSPVAGGYRMYWSKYVQNSQHVAQVVSFAKSNPSPSILAYPVDPEILSSFVVMTYADRPVIETYTLGDVNASLERGKRYLAVVTDEGVGQLSVHYDLQTIERSDQFSLIWLKRK